MYGGDARLGREDAGHVSRLRRDDGLRRTEALGWRTAPASLSVSPEGRPARQGPNGPVRRTAEGRGGASAPAACTMQAGPDAALTNAGRPPRFRGTAFC